MFQDKVVLITGGNTGIGKAAAIEFAKQGAIVIITYLSGSLKILSKLNEGMAIKADITKKRDINKIIRKIDKEYGRIDVLVNNAGILKHSKMKGLTIQQWKATFEVNLFGVFELTKNAKKLMKKGGKIVNVGSIRGLEASNRDMDYSASKAGMISLTESLAKELAPKINVNCVCPGITKTKLVKNYRKSAKRTSARTLLKRMAEPSEIADAIVFLASDKASYITGQTLVVDGGYMIS